jgi:hypothetical protein
MPQIFLSLKFLIPFSALIASAGSVLYLNRKAMKPRESFDAPLVPAHLLAMIAMLVAIGSVIWLVADFESFYRLAW